jgi:PAS domain S-box-containing protein
MRHAPLNVDWKAGARDCGSCEAPHASPSTGPLDSASAMDFSPLNEVLENFLEVIHLPIAVIDLEGRVLASSRWQRLCMEFHRAHPVTQERCVKSDTVLSREMRSGSDWAIYRCANGLTDCATPIVVEGTHIANLFTGQFLLAAPDMDYFRKLQTTCGFDERSYFEALSEIPIVAEERIPAILRLLRGLAQQIARQSLAEKKARSAYQEVERLVAERTRELRESEERFRTFMDNSPAVAWIKDERGEFVYASKVWEKQFGLTSKDYLGKTDFDIWPGELAEAFRQGDAAVLEANCPIRSEEKATVLKTGKESYWLTDKFPLGDRTGRRYVGGMAIDISDRRQMEDELRTHQTHLEDLVGARTRELAQRNAMLEEATAAADQANKAKSAFLANMSHEIRTPLNAIVGMAHLLRRDGVTPQQDTRLGRIEVAADHLLNLINDVLDLSKIEAGMFTLDDRALAVDRVLQNVGEILSPRASGKGLRLLISHEPLQGEVRGDATRLTQALLNYANNALKFSERGTIAIRSRVIDENEDAAVLRFEVEDEGIGIAPEQLGCLFAPFVQGDASTTRKFGGTGLGLAITRHLAELMGGSAGATSEPGRGSIFWFTARLKKVRAVPGNASSPPLESAEHVLAAEYGGTRVLLAEDDPTNQELGRELLDAIGFRVDLAVNGAQAVELAQRNLYGLVLMDLQMPTMDGLQATREIRRIPGMASVPILALTANALGEDRERCLAAGLDDHLTKPLAPEKLYCNILKWLRLCRPESVKPAGAAVR